jgi:hypothetical protein
LTFYEGVGVLKIKESELKVLKIEESELKVLKIEESELELLCTDSTALITARLQKEGYTLQLCFRFEISTFRS